MVAPLGTNATDHDLAVGGEAHRAQVPGLGRRSRCSVAGGQIFATSWPVLPASGVPEGHVEPSV